jgi:hypothetical protein
MTSARSAARPIPPFSNRKECYHPPLAERMKRRLFNLAALLSLLLCVASLALWVRSYYVFDRWTFGSITDNPYLRRDYESWSVAGTIGFSGSTVDFTGPFAGAGVPLGLQLSSRRIEPDDEVLEPPPVAIPSLLGFSFMYGHQRFQSVGLSRYAAVSAPDAALALAFAVCPAIWAARKRGTPRSS